MPTRSALRILALVMLAACTGEPRPSEEPAIGADTVAVETADSGVKACDLVSAADIADVTRVDVVSGITTNDYMGVSQCRFDREDGTQDVMVSLHEHGNIDNYRNVPGATDVPGVGDAAVWNADTNQFAFRRDDAVASISFLFKPAESRWAVALARIALLKLDGR